MRAAAPCHFLELASAILHAALDYLRDTTLEVHKHHFRHISLLSRASATCLIPLVVLPLWSCASAEPETIRVTTVMTSSPSGIYASACLPERCYRDLGHLKYAEGFGTAEIDVDHIDATEHLKRLAVEEYGGRVDAIISLKATKDPSEDAVLVSGEAVQFVHRSTFSCTLQRLASA